MNSSLKVLGAGAVALALWLNAARAQSDDSAQPKSADISGLLGRGDISLEAGVFKVRNETVNPTGLAGDTAINLPIDDGFDYRMDFAYEHAARTGLKLSDTRAENGVTYYYRTKVLTPFVTAGFGYGWSHDTVKTVATRSNHFLVEAATGVEVPVSKAAAVRLGVDYDESARHPHSRVVDYNVLTNYWFNDTVGASLGAVIRQGRNGAHDAALYTAGVHFSID